MNRIAILIGSPLSEKHPNYLSGVKYDIKNFSNFLKSSTGGAWSENEIIRLKNPTIQQFSEVKTKFSGRDFAFVYFSGHGSYSKRIKDQVLNINDNKQISGAHFLNFAKKQITLFDACRVFSDWSGFLGGIEQPDLVYDYGKPEQAKINYMSYIQGINNGQAVLFSTQQGNTAQEDPSNGGFFSSSILLAASKFAQFKTEENILDVYNAFLSSNQIIQNVYTSEQEPRIAKSSDSALLLPFAVKPYSYIQNQYSSMTKPIKQNTDDETWKWVVGGALGIVGLALIGKALINR